MSEPIHIISLGAGVQSSTMALMAACGEITPMPVAAVFADVGDEPTDVYRYLEWLINVLPFTVRVVRRGVLSSDFLGSLTQCGSHAGQPPLYVTSEDPCGGMLRRKCTTEYKLQPLRMETRKLIAEHEAEYAVAWIGISTDEAHRMKDSDVKYSQNRYPLIERRMSRHDCIRWLQAHKHKLPPKSACVYCPYTSDVRWRDMKLNRPDDWWKAVQFDRQLRSESNHPNGAGIAGKLYLHKSLRPIEDVDFSSEEDRGQLNMFGNDCTGLCGV